MATTQSCLLATTNFLHGADLFFTHGTHHRQDQVLALSKSILDLGKQSIISGKLQVILSVATLS